MKFRFTAKIYSLYLFIVFVMFLILLINNVFSLVNQYKIDSSYNNLRPFINVVILFSVFTISIGGMSLYAFRYLVMIENDILTIRLIFKKKKYDLNNLTSYEKMKYGKNTKFVIFFGRKKRTIVTSSEEPLNEILNEYIIK